MHDYVEIPCYLFCSLFINLFMKPPKSSFEWNKLC